MCKSNRHPQNAPFLTPSYLLSLQLEASNLHDKLQLFSSDVYLNDVRECRVLSGADKVNACSPFLQPPPPTRTVALLERVATRSLSKPALLSYYTHDLTDEKNSPGDDTTILFVFPMQKRALVRRHTHCGSFTLTQLIAVRIPSRLLLEIEKDST